MLTAFTADSCFSKKHAVASRSMAALLGTIISFLLFLRVTLASLGPLDHQGLKVKR